MQTILLIVAMCFLINTPAQAACMPTLDPQAIAFKRQAEKIFLIYTEGKVKNYKISDPSICADIFYVQVEGTGRDLKLGGYWTVTFNKKNLQMAIAPGE